MQQLLHSQWPCNILLLPTASTIEIIEMSQIIRIQAISNYCKLFFADPDKLTGRGKTLVVAKLLKWFEAMLPPTNFIRIHRTHLVNRKYLQPGLEKEMASLVLLNGETLGVARRKKKEVMEKLAAVV